MTDLVIEEKRHVWKIKIEEWRASGLSARKWCLDRDIPEGTFNYWKKLFALEIKPEKNLFLELTQEKTKGVEIEYQGFKIRLEKDFDNNLLLDCLRVLRRIPC